MVPNWDIHPEMITHTRVIDIKTGQPVAGANDATMENSFPQTDISTDELASYLAYALKILKNCELPCEGITTPGGFGNRVKDKLPLAVHQAVREVYGAELPHFFKYVAEDSNTEPKLEFVSGKRDVSQLTMNIPAGTGDWFGGWDGDEKCQSELYANADATGGRMVELIELGKPAVMLCHWPGLYCHGSKQGFQDFQRVVLALHERFSKRILWLKLSEIGRYWAAKELTELSVLQDRVVSINAPISCADFTFRLRTRRGKLPVLHFGDTMCQLKEVNTPELLIHSTYWSSNDETIACFDLPRGQSRLEF
jgi:hypothetical protein